MKTLEEAQAKVAELEQRAARAEGEARAAKEARRGVRRKLRLELAAKAQRHIANLQRVRAPGDWTDGAVVALARFHKEINETPDDGPDEEG